MISISSISEKQKHLLNDGKILPVMEHFYTLQGEGAHAGKAAYFIRLGGCDVGCHWCDVKDSWDAEAHPLINVDELAQSATNLSKIIVITGGEPLMWNLNYLTNKLRELGAKIHLETSGAYALSGNIDWITLSPKKRAEVKPDVLAKASELKCVIYNQDDFNYAEKHAQLVNENCKLYLQAEWSKREKVTPDIIEFIKKNPKWSISLQTHKYLNIP